MLQYWLQDLLKPVLTGVKVTVDYEPDTPTYATIFYEGGAQPGKYDISWRYPRFMIWVESDDWGRAQYLAYLIFKTVHNYHKKHGVQQITVEYQNERGEVLDTEEVELHKLEAASDPNPLGILDGKMRYSLNFTATITNQKEETTDETSA